MPFVSSNSAQVGPKIKTTATGPALACSFTLGPVCKQTYTFSFSREKLAGPRPSPRTAGCFSMVTTCMKTYTPTPFLHGSTKSPLGISLPHFPPCRPAAALLPVPRCSLEPARSASLNRPCPTRLGRHPYLRPDMCTSQLAHALPRTSRQAASAPTDKQLLYSLPPAATVLSPFILLSASSFPIHSPATSLQCLHQQRQQDIYTAQLGPTYYSTLDKPHQPCSYWSTATSCFMAKRRSLLAFDSLVINSPKTNVKRAGHFDSQRGVLSILGW